jgi:hypothetical protein
MPWPGSIGRLLAMPDSQAAQALRWGLHGLRASLQAALEEAPDDPGGEALRELLAELDPLLAPGAGPAGPVLPPDGPGSRLPGAEIPGLPAAGETASPGPIWPRNGSRGVCNSPSRPAAGRMRRLLPSCRCPLRK